MVGCSIPTGQISIQAPHERHDHSVSAGMISPTNCGPPSFTLPWVRSAKLRKSRIRSRGLSGAPLARAGQASWQRPHLVQASKLSRSFHANWLMAEIPISPSVSVATRGRRLSAFTSRLASEPITAIICLALFHGRAAMKVSAKTPWTHQLARRTAAALSGSIPRPENISASNQPTGDQPAHGGCSCTRRTPSCK